MDRLISLCLSGIAPALPHDWWLQWSLAPVPLLAVAALCWWAQRAAPQRRGLAWAGALLCALAWISPLCRLGATLAAGHMVQLMVVIAAGALLALGAPSRVPTRALAAWTALHAALLWLWHLPALYTAILVDPVIHLGTWALLLASSFAFWRAVLASLAARPLVALLAVLVTMVHTGLLGALLTFAGRAFYAVQAPGALAWGLEPLADQQLAGLLMWVAGGGAYVAVVAGLAIRIAHRAGSAAGGQGQPAV